MRQRNSGRRLLPIGAALLAVLLGGAGSALQGACGPFTDLAADSFCAFVLEIFTLGITTGTTPTTYEPGSNVSRLQMAAFLSRTVDGALKRGSRRASLDQFWTTQNATVLGMTTVGANPQTVRSDGADLWVANFGGTVARVRASDGKLLEQWTGAASADGVAIAMGRVVVAGGTVPGYLYGIDPSQPAGAVTTLATNLGGIPIGVAFDGGRFWTANFCAPGSVSIVTPGATTPWTVTTVTTGFTNPFGALYDGSNVWVTNFGARSIVKLDANGAILLTATVGLAPQAPIFDGSNIWVPNIVSSTVTVVRASNGAVLATLTGNGLLAPYSAAFDGQRILVPNQGGDNVSLWKAADLTTLGTFPTGTASAPIGSCSDGIHFWITLNTPGQLARF